MLDNIAFLILYLLGRKTVYRQYSKVLEEEKVYGKKRLMGCAKWRYQK